VYGIPVFPATDNNAGVVRIQADGTVYAMLHE